MLQNKQLDGVCLNILENSESFGSDTNSVTFITPTHQVDIPNADKLSIAFSITQNAKKIQEDS